MPRSNRFATLPDRPDRKPRPVTPDWLMRAAVHYLERYASTADNLRRVLRRKIAARRFAPSAGGDVEIPDTSGDAALIENTIARLVDLKLLDDGAFAEARFATLRRRGTSLRGAKAKLAEKGVDRQTIDTVVAADETAEDDAARRFAQRRRLGPHRTKDRQAKRDRDIAAMMRAGFSLADARAAIDAPTGEDQPD